MSSTMLRAVLLLCTCAHIMCESHVKEPERHKVIIIGAGVSGFTAAVTLLEHNVTDVLVLEASNRIGGRIHTVEFGGVPIDIGAEFVHGEKNNSVYDLVSPFNFLVSYQPLLSNEKYMFVNTSGHGIHSIPVKALIDNSFSIFEEQGLANFNGSLGDYFYPRLEEILKDSNVESHIAEGIQHVVPIFQCLFSACGTLYEVGTKDYFVGHEEKVDLYLKWKTGGYKTLFDIVSKKYPNPHEEIPVVNKTILGKQAIRVEHNMDEGVKVTCADGSTYLADHVIVTVSLGVLKKHAATMFHPTLSSKKTAAIETINFGCAGKVFLLFPTKWWPNDTNVIMPLLTRKEIEKFNTTSVHGYWTSNSAGFYPVMNHERMLCTWFVGESCKTMESLTDEQVTDGVMELLDTLLGKMFKIPKPEKILRTAWARNPFVLGICSHRSAESDRRNLTHEDIAAPIMHGDKPVVMFAGEATDTRHASAVNGALDTGRREAHRIIDYLKSYQA